MEHYYISYDWLDDDTIVYSTDNPGFTIYNVDTKIKKEHLDEFYYDNLRAANKDTIYGIKMSKWTSEGTDYAANNGVVEINLKDYDLKNKVFSINTIITVSYTHLRDPRDEMPKPILRQDVLKIEDLKKDMVLNGTVRNVVDFGAFIDIGVKEDGLVHISQLSNRYIKHPKEVVKVGDIVKVRIMEVDMERGRIALSMKEV